VQAPHDRLDPWVLAEPQRVQQLCPRVLVLLQLIVAVRDVLQILLKKVHRLVRSGRPHVTILAQVVENPETRLSVKRHVLHWSNVVRSS
jgi:hypothetical protein